MPSIANRIVNNELKEVIDLEENRQSQKYSDDEIKRMADNRELFCPKCNAQYNVFTRFGKIFFGASYKGFKHEEDCSEYTKAKEIINKTSFDRLYKWYYSLVGEEMQENTIIRSHSQKKYEDIGRRVRAKDLTKTNNLVNSIIDNPLLANERISEDLFIKDLFVWKQKIGYQKIISESSYPFIMVFTKGKSCNTSIYTNYTKMRLIYKIDDENQFIIYLNLEDFDFYSHFGSKTIYGYALINPLKIRNIAETHCVIDISKEESFFGSDDFTKRRVNQLKYILKNIN